MTDKNFGQKSNLQYLIAITKHITVVQTDFQTMSVENFEQSQI
jgi:hypothetical protein